jgi:hypothetical protein
MEKDSSIPFFYINTSIPTYSGNEPLQKTILTEHQKRILYYIRLLESENPIPILSPNETQNLYFHTNYAFYADPICTGKSFVVLSLLSLHRILERKKLLTIWSNGLGMNVFSKVENFEIPMSFLVVPHSSIAQWETLFKEETNILYFVADSEEAIEMINTNDYEVLIISDSVFDKVCIHFEGFSVSRLIFDDLIHLEIKNVSQTKNNTNQFTNGGPVLFGDLRASFTWFICSEPYQCLQKYKNSNLPFALLIKQIFSFPYPGLIFRSENKALENSLCKILPSHLEVFNYGVTLPSVTINSLENLSDELEDIFRMNNKDLIQFHLLEFINNQKDFTIETYNSISNRLCYDKKVRFDERYQTNMDPITFESIQFPIYVKCCDQIFDMFSILQCLRQDKRCPFCRKETKWKDCIGIEKFQSENSKSIWIKDKKLDLMEYLNQVDKNKYTVLYIPSLHRASKIQKESRIKLQKLIQNLDHCYLYYNDKIQPKQIFEEFKKQKGILIIHKPIESNLHLSFVDKIIVIHPKEFISSNEKVWYSKYLQKYYSEGLLKRIYLNDRELGNFVIGGSNHLSFEFLSLY